MNCRNAWRVCRFIFLLVLFLTACNRDQNATTDSNTMDSGRPVMISVDHGFMYFNAPKKEIDYFDIESQKNVTVIPSAFCDGKPLMEDSCQGSLTTIPFNTGFFKDDRSGVSFFWESFGEEGARFIQLVRMDKDGQNLKARRTEIKNSIQGVVQLKGLLYVIEVQESSEETIVQCISLKGKKIEEIEFPGNVMALIPDDDRLHFIQGDASDLHNSSIEFYDVKKKVFGKTEIEAGGDFKVKDGNVVAVVRDETVDYTVKEAFSIVFFPKGSEPILLEKNAGNVFFSDDGIVTTHDGLILLDEKEQKSINRYDFTGMKREVLSLEEGFFTKGICCGHLITYREASDQLKVYPLGSEQ